MIKISVTEDKGYEKKEIIKLDNGYYLETIIEETSMARATNQKTARKTANYKNAQGAIMFSVTVTGTFTYTGSSSTCTKSVAEASSKNTNWKISSKQICKITTEKRFWKRML